MKHESQKKFYEAKRDISDEIRDSYKIMSDLWEGISAFREIENCVTVYGSARFKEGHIYYELARNMGKTLAENGFTVMTGGGPGVMEAANRGAKEGGGTSLGCNIVLPFEQKPNPYVDKMVEFDFFFTRKTILRKNSLAYVLMPGGLGTMDEIFEVLTLIQTKKLPHRPIVCLGKNYWEKLSNFIRDTMIQEGTISEEDLNLLFMTDNTAEAIEYIKSHIIKKT